MRFFDDESKICERCGSAILPGDTYYKIDDSEFCSWECAAEEALEASGIYIDEEHLMTAADKEEEYADGMMDV